MCDGCHWQSARPYTDHESPLDVREDAKALVTVFGLFVAWGIVCTLSGCSLSEGVEVVDFLVQLFPPESVVRSSVFMWSMVQTGGYFASEVFFFFFWMVDIVVGSIIWLQFCGWLLLWCKQRTFHQGRQNSSSLHSGMDPCSFFTWPVNIPVYMVLKISWFHFLSDLLLLDQSQMWMWPIQS